MRLLPLIPLLAALTCGGQTMTGAGTFTGAGNWYGLTNPVAGLVGWWKFDTNSGTVAIDSSGYGNNGTFAGATKPTWTNGIVNGGIHTAGTSGYITTPLATAFGNFTAALWFVYNPDDSQSATTRIIDKTYDTGFWIGKTGVAGTNQWGGGIRQSGAPYGSFLSIPTAGWNHLCMMRSNTTQFIYLNGALATNTTVSATALTGSALTIGATAVPSAGFVGELDDVRIYNRAITAEEVKQIYNLGRGIP
jgi:hypothetical protein